MAVRARLTPPRETQTDWTWHKVNSASLPASMLFGGGRRMEAETFLADGFATRLQIQSKRDGWLPMIDLAEVRQPNRLKGTLVSPDYGIPFLAATQVFDIRPRSRKWLSVNQINDVSTFFVNPRTILVTRSGTVGRATIALESLNGKIISDDLLRIEPRSTSYWGWLYAYLRAPSVIALMQAAHYGHVIKHLEVSHMNDVPVVDVDEQTRDNFTKRVSRIFENRNRAALLTEEAETLLSNVFRLPAAPEDGNTFSPVRASEVLAGRRRMEGAFHAAPVRALVERLHTKALRIENIEDIVEKVWWMNRFSRNFGADGVPYMSADELFSISQVSEKRVYTDPVPNYRDFFVRDGWILMACSGQVYGLNGSVTLATQYDENFFFSHDLIRIAPRPGAIRSGYLFAYLGHPDLGQVLIRRTAYGSSVPHIDPGDVQKLPIARVDPEIENRIADLAEEASRLRAEATEFERAVGQDADDIVREFIS